MTHGSVPKEQRDILGIGDNFLRISVGLEDAKDLIADLNQALIKAVSFEFTIKCILLKYESLTNFMNQYL